MTDVGSQYDKIVNLDMASIDVWKDIVCSDAKDK